MPTVADMHPTLALSFEDWGLKTPVQPVPGLQIRMWRRPWPAKRAITQLQAITMAVGPEVVNLLGGMAAQAGAGGFTAEVAKVLARDAGAVVAAIAGNLADWWGGFIVPVLTDSVWVARAPGADAVVMPLLEARGAGEPDAGLLEEATGGQPTLMLALAAMVLAEQTAPFLKTTIQGALTRRSRSSGGPST